MYDLYYNIIVYIINHFESNRNKCLTGQCKTLFCFTGLFHLWRTSAILFSVIVVLSGFAAVLIAVFVHKYRGKILVFELESHVLFISQSTNSVQQWCFVSKSQSYYFILHLRTLFSELWNNYIILIYFWLQRINELILIYKRLKV